MPAWTASTGLYSAAMATAFRPAPRLTGAIEPEDAALGKLVSLAGVRNYPSRIKCALLGWHALMQALDEKPAHA